MSKKQHEIDDNEIRIISAQEPEIRKANRRSPRIFLFILISIIGIVGIGIIFIQSNAGKENDAAIDAPETAVKEPAPIINNEEKTIGIIKGFTIAVDTAVNKKRLLILSPVNARPRLIIGKEGLNDTNIVLATQAADIRSDNGQIVGTFVLNGEVISKGEAKAGFCSIINGELSIGLAPATPMLEQTLTDGGYYFRQYPLVVGGQIVENKPKGKAIRKALVEIGSKIYVVMSRERLTFHDFSQLLIDVGARNAIYLVGSSSHSFYVNEEGKKIMMSNAPSKDIENVSYIIWERE